MTKFDQDTTVTESRRGPRVDAPSTPSCPLRIAVVDGDRSDHLLMSMAADSAALDASLAFFGNSIELLQQLEQSIELRALPDLILLEWRVPGFTGQRTLDILQAHDVLWQIPVVVFTRSSRRIDRTRALASGARSFEVKPQQFSGMVDFARTLPGRANSSAYTLPDDDCVVIDLTSPDGRATTRGRRRQAGVAYDTDWLV